MYGNGWPGSTASGVSTGKISLRRTRSAQRGAVGRWHSSAVARCSMPCAAERRAGRRREDRRLRGDERRGPRARSRRSCSSGVRPSGSGSRRCRPRPAACRPATRTMKNSSRLLAKIARNLTRSSSGMCARPGLGEHALVELEPGQLAVEVRVGRRLRVGRRVVGRGRTAGRAGAPGSIAAIGGACGLYSGVARRRRPGGRG